MTLWAWLLITIGMAASFGTGHIVGWVRGDDHGRDITNREWTAQAERRHQWTRITYADQPSKETA